MAELVPLPFDVLLRRLAFELGKDACFDLPARSFWKGDPQLDFSARFHGERAANPLGPAAGPQSQLAQNIVLSYLAGARVFELKTVQILDQLKLPRPCIDATNVGFNVEWSQELRLPQSRREYVHAWALLWALRQADQPSGAAGPSGEFLFDLSVGYDLDGIRSPKVGAFLAGMLDARAELDRLWETWPSDLIRFRPDRERVPNRISSCVTLSTFHGCPAEQIERICEHLIDEVGVHVVVKLNPTLLGYPEVCELLRGKLGYDELVPHRPSFDSDLKWDEVLGLIRRLSDKAERAGLTLGAKFSNTLVVENHKTFFPASEKVMYLSGTPLHALSFDLCLKFRQAYGRDLPISFSAGVDNKNFADCVASGFTPITTCTDLLKPGGYARLPRYLEALRGRMQARGAKDLLSFILAEHRANEGARHDGPSSSEGEGAIYQASLANHRAAAKRVLEDPRYSAQKNRAVPRRLGSKLWFFDCVSCDKCVQVCPNDANFALDVPSELTAPVALPKLVVRNGGVVEDGTIEFQLKGSYQIANYADFCNECGNCDVFCPEEGGPYVVKPRLFGSKESFEHDPKRQDGFYVERSGQLERIHGRHLGAVLSLEVDRATATARFDDGAAEVELTWPGYAYRGGARVRQGTPEGHAIRLDQARGLGALLSGIFAEGASSWVNGPYLRVNR